MIGSAHRLSIRRRKMCLRLGAAKALPTSVSTHDHWVGLLLGDGAPLRVRVVILIQQGQEIEGVGEDQGSLLGYTNDEIIVVHRPVERHLVDHSDHGF